MLFKLIGLVVLLGVNSICFALPEGPVAVLGGAEVLTHQETLVVRQESASLIINWQKFDISASELVQFVMPESNNVAINRVVGAFAPSQIDGRLLSNGEVILLNPAGVMFGPRAFVDVAALMASSAMPLDLLGKNTEWSLEADAGDIVNHGTIHIAKGGSVLFLGAHALQKGQILGNNLTLLLLSGNQGLAFLKAGLLQDQKALAALPVQVQQYGDSQVFVVGEVVAELPSVINLEGIAAQSVVDAGALLSLL